MNYKSVLEEQIRELQKLSDININSTNSVGSKVDVAVCLSEQINRTIELIIRQGLK